MNGESWIILTTRFGEDHINPDITDLKKAMEELLTLEDLGLSEQEKTEFNHIGLRFGYEEGPMYMLEVFCDQKVIFSQWADPDHQRELSPKRIIPVLPEEKILSLLRMLALGQVENLKSIFKL